jgi:uncharacterized protein YqhQ
MIKMHGTNVKIIVSLILFSFKEENSQDLGIVWRIILKCIIVWPVSFGSVVGCFGHGNKY